MVDQAQTPHPTDAEAAGRDEVVDEGRETVTVRRAPKYAVFIVLGGALGVFAAMILTFAFHGTDQASDAGFVYSPGQVFGFLALYCGAGGVLIGGVVALVLDRTIGRRQRRVVVDREHVHTAD